MVAAVDDAVVAVAGVAVVTDHADDDADVVVADVDDDDLSLIYV